MAIPGIYQDPAIRDPALADTLRPDPMERYGAVPNTVMVNAWRPDLEWVIVDATYPAQISRRCELLLSRRHMVVDRLPGADVVAAEHELRDALVDYLLQAYPGCFRRDGDFILAPLTGLAIDTGRDGADPLLAIALLASEDMLLLLPERRGPDRQAFFVLKSGALLFPNDWALRSLFNKPEPEAGQEAARQQWQEERQRSLRAARLGKTPREVHDGRVPHYMEHYAGRVDRFFAQMRPGMRAWRRNWSMKMSGELFLHADAPAASLPDETAENWEKHGYLRTEQQTFTKLPRTGAVVFGIKTYLWKLSEVVQNPAALNALITASDNLPPAMVAYRARELQTFREFLDLHRPGASLLRPMRAGPEKLHAGQPD